MDIETCRKVAKATACDWTLLQTARSIEAELLAFAAKGERATAAHFGQIELMTACTEELVARGYSRGRKGPAWVETNCEDGIRYSVTMRVF